MTMLMLIMMMIDSNDNVDDSVGLDVVDDGDGG